MGNHLEHYEGIRLIRINVAIINHTYDKDLHLKILEAVIPIADKVVNNFHII